MDARHTQHSYIIRKMWRYLWLTENDALHPARFRDGGCQ